ncbi:hypothetical protein NL676_027379 [Syzygium grande]|nr:hypothetical protein NL676_027379 [Syzygium grande]
MHCIDTNKGALKIARERAPRPAIQIAAGYPRCGARVRDRNSRAGDARFFGQKPGADEISAGAVEVTVKK